MPRTHPVVTGADLFRAESGFLTPGDIRVSLLRSYGLVVWRGSNAVQVRAGIWLYTTGKAQVG